MLPLSDGDARASRLKAEISRRVIDGGDDPSQIAKDLGAPVALVQAVATVPSIEGDTE